MSTPESASPVHPGYKKTPKTSGVHVPQHWEGHGLCESLLHSEGSLFSCHWLGLVSGSGAEPSEEAASVLSLETVTICSGNPHSGSPSHPREPVPTLPAPQESWVLIARATRGDASLNLGFPFSALTLRI